MMDGKDTVASEMAKKASPSPSVSYHHWAARLGWGWGGEAQVLFNLFWGRI